MSGSGQSSDEQLAAFRAKVTRLQKRGPVATLAPIGPAEDQLLSPRARRRTERRTRAAAKPPREPVRPMIFAIALVLGAAAVVGARFGRAEWLADFFPSALSGERDGLAMLSDFTAALVFGLLLTAMLGARSRQFVAAQTIGAGAMVLAMHNLVHAAPDLWQMAFPPAWVGEVLVTTEPRSILITGISFQL